jgi:hypothetical protein
VVCPGGVDLWVVVGLWLCVRVVVCCGWALLLGWLPWLGWVLVPLCFSWWVVFSGFWWRSLLFVA